jgi:YVTN family beta-propeller protein
LYQSQTGGTDSPSFYDQPIGSPINGKSCSISTDFQNRPLSLSDAVQHGLTSNPAPSNRVQNPRPAPAAAAAASSSLLNTFPFLAPLAFPPLFPLSDAGKLVPNCPASLGAYLVNHLDGTVTSVGLCPQLHVNAEIVVQSNPLQVAVTPDGSTALVTSYDSAVTFIDTATDKVTFTLVTPGYYPQGIAISPDGTRAYVTNYDDANQCLLVIDIPNRRMLSTISLPQVYPRVVAVTPDGTQAWVNYWTDSEITVVDLLSGTVSAHLNFGSPIDMGMAFNPAGTKAFVAADPNLLLVIDTATLTKLAQVAVGPSPDDVVVLPNGHLVFVNSSLENGTWLVDAVKNTLIAAPSNPTQGGSMGLTVF